MSNERKGLAELYDDQPLDGHEPQGQAAPKGEQPETGEGQTATPQGGAATPSLQQSSQGAPPAPKAEPPAGYVPVAALEDVRRRAQRAEREYQELQRRLTAPNPQPEQAQPKPQPLSLPDPVTEPEKYVEAVRDLAVKEAEAKLDARLRERDEQEYAYRADESEAAFAEKHGDDYFAKKAAFVEELEARAQAGDESLLKQLRASRNPAAFAYRIGSEILMYREIGNDPAAYKRKIIEQYEAERGGGQQPPSPAAQAKPAVPSPTPQRQTPAVPRSMAGVTSAGPRSAGPRPIARRSLTELYDG
jgi:hypothetical protein